MLGESKHTLGTFEHALENVRNNVMMMASQTERSLNRALKGLMERDDELAALPLPTTKKSTARKTDRQGWNRTAVTIFNRSRPICAGWFRR